jgi:hypothetical protein
MLAVMMPVRGKDPPGPLLIPGSHQEADAEDSRETALVLVVQLARDAFGFQHVFEELRLGEAGACMHLYRLVHVHGKDSLKRGKSSPDLDGHAEKTYSR